MSRPSGVALITGVTGEIGGHLADQLSADGWTVCGLDRRPLEGERDFSFLQCDLSDSGDTERKIELFHERVGAFDAVVNCAGLIANAPLVSFVDGQLVHHDPLLWDRVL